ncbi:MAG TPA: hypothetical protein PK307_17270 [Spirochaetota bacterium]|nr:hypothetical protein [Spirochaetota bacterium]HOD13227.1 hypothetical protein [Spirochaetota bacterium]HPG48965.1 hypothetical protein [Spirochaetota bacterium]HPN10474.1 hypothetical protein [Spirochaetota bacterium]HQL83954.1 hypothetical protein [Spirochaetota bacterium]
MRYFNIILVVALVAACAVSCKMKKEITLEDYAKIESEINLPNPELDRAKVEGVAKQYGYTYEQYKDMFDKVEKDPSLKEKLGELHLQEQNKDAK